MAVERDIRVVRPRADGPATPTTEEPSLGRLLRQLGDDASALVSDEVALAKVEMRQAAQALASDLAKVGAAIALAAVGGLALAAFLVIVIGNALDGAYWAGALIVGAVFLLIGGIMAGNAMSDLRKNQDMRLTDTRESLMADKRWAKHEAREFKREIRA